MHESKQPDFINETDIRRSAGDLLEGYIGKSSLVGGPLGEFERTPEDDKYAIKGRLPSGETAGVLRNGKFQIEGLDDNTAEIYMPSHLLHHMAGEEVPFDEDCNICSPDS